MANKRSILCALATSAILIGCTTTAPTSSAPSADDATSAESGEPAAKPAVNEVRIDGEPVTLAGLPRVATDATLVLAVSYGVRDVPDYLGVDIYAPDDVPDKASEKIVNAFALTGAFSDIVKSGSDSQLTGKVYSLDVVLNPTVDLDRGSKTASFLTLGLNAAAGQKLTTEFALDTETSLFSFGGASDSKLLMVDTHSISGAATSTTYRKQANVDRAWNAALDVSVPHMVRAVISKIDQEEQEAVPPPQPVTTEPVDILDAPEAPKSPASTNTPAAEPPEDELEPLPELDSLEDLPSLD